MTDSQVIAAGRVGRAHIVDTLIEERAGPLLQRPLVWPLIRTFGFPLLRYREAVEMVDGISELDGVAAFDWLSTRLALDVQAQGLEHIPASGRLILVANHPTGIADGVAVWDAVRSVRRDLIYFANRDAVRVAPRMVSAVIPVEWVHSRRTRARTRETLKASINAFREERAVVVFPSGRMAWQDGKRLRERPWLNTAVNLATRYNAPVLPVHISARNSWLFYWLSRWNEQLRDMSLFHEMLNKRDYPYHLRFGPLIQPLDLAGDQAEVTSRLQQWVEDGLPAGQPFPAPAAG